MHNKSIDWEQSVALTGGQKDLAKKLLMIFMDSLPDAHRQIVTAFTVKNYQIMAEQVHKLYGACCYCSLPPLKEILTALGDALRNNQYQLLAALCQQFTQEVVAIEHVFKDLVAAALQE